MVFIFILTISIIGLKKYLSDEPPNFEIEYLSINEPVFLDKEEKEHPNKDVVVFSTLDVRSEELRFPTYIFNLNIVNDSLLSEIGYNKGQRNSFLNFRKSIGHFYHEDQLYKLYAWEKAEVDTLLKHAEIVLPVLKVNRLNDEEWQSIHGIGSVLSARINLYRSKLGGYYNSEQFKQVYGLEEEVVENIKRKYQLDFSGFAKIDFLTVQLSELIEHPYFSQRIAKEIIMNRSMGLLNDSNDLKQIVKQDWKKISPYVKF
jgi:hypothetical protein